MKNKGLKIKELSEADFSDIMDSDSINISMYFVPLRVAYLIFGLDSFAPSGYQRPHKSKRRQPYRNAQISTMMAHAAMLYHGKLKMSANVAEGTIISNYVCTSAPSGIVFPGTPLYITIKDGKIYSCPDGCGRLSLLWDFRHDLVTIPKSIKNPREKNVLSSCKGMTFKDLSEEAQNFLLDNIYFSIYAMDADDKFERYIYEIVNGGCPQSTDDKTNSQAAGNLDYDATKSLLDKMTDPHNQGQFIEFFCGPEVLASWKQIKPSWGKMFGCMTRFQNRNMRNWPNNQTLKEDFYRPNNASRTAEQAKADADWAATCIVYAMDVLNNGASSKANGNPARFPHVLDAVAAMLSDMVSEIKENSNTRRKDKVILKNICETLKRNGFASRMSEVICSSMNVDTSEIRKVCGVFTSKDFYRNADTNPCQLSYQAIKQYETKVGTPEGPAQLFGLLGETPHDKKPTDFVRCYLGYKVMEMYNIPNPAASVKEGK